MVKVGIQMFRHQTDRIHKPSRISPKIISNHPKFRLINTGNRLFEDSLQSDSKPRNEVDKELEQDCRIGH